LTTFCLLAARRIDRQRVARATRSWEDQFSKVEKVERSQSSPSFSTDHLRLPRTRSERSTVVFEDSAFARDAAADVISENTVNVLRASRSSQPGNSVSPERNGPMQHNLPEQEGLPRTSFDECKSKARELLETSAKLAGLHVGANGQVVDESTMQQCKDATPTRLSSIQNSFSAKIMRSASDSSQSSVTSMGGSFSSAMVAGKFAARFRQKVFKKQAYVIVSGSDLHCYDEVKNGIRLYRKANTIVSQIKAAKEKAQRESLEEGRPESAHEDKVYFEDSPWCPTFDTRNAHYFNGGQREVEIGLDRIPTPHDFYAR
jgi:hypothetical protein